MVSSSYDGRMKKISTLFLSALLIPALGAYAQHHEKKDKSDLSLPPVVTPGIHGNPDKAGMPPSDAIVLFDGKNFKSNGKVRLSSVVLMRLSNLCASSRGTFLVF